MAFMGGVLLLLLSHFSGGNQVRTKIGYMTECLGAVMVIAGIVYGPDMTLFRTLDSELARSMAGFPTAFISGISLYCI